MTAKSVIAVGSGKGGVGKSTVAAALAASGATVTVLGRQQGFVLVSLVYGATRYDEWSLILRESLGLDVVDE